MAQTNSINVSVRQMSRLLKRLGVSNGDVLAIKYKSENANKQAIDIITHAFEKMGINVLVIVVDDFDDLSILNETAMNQRGWFKLKSLAKIMRLPEKDVEQ
jgi:hypothetical protein